LGDQVLRGEITMMEYADYIRTVVDFLERVPAEVVVERISGDAPPSYLIEPKWCLQKSVLRKAIESEFARRGTRQGSLCRHPNLHPRERPRPDDRTPPSIRAEIDQRGRLPVLKLQE
jgi:hypothetical protein